MSLRKRTVAAGCSVVLAIGLSACGSSDEGSGGDGGEVATTWKGTGELEGTGEIAIFMPGGGLPFNTNFRNAAEEYLKGYGYTVKVFENAYDQAEQDQQVQQYIATGAKPAGVIFYPGATAAAKNSARQLVRLAPTSWSVAGPTTMPSPFGGNNHTRTGELEAAAYQELMATLEQDGVALPNDGAILVYNAPVEILSGKTRLDGFKAQLKEDGVDVEIVGEENGMVSKTTGYDLASGSLAKYADKFDVIWALNLDGAIGVVQALKEAGRTPGEDVWVIAGGDCTPGLSSIENGDIYNTISEGGAIEGIQAARTQLSLMATGEATDGTVQLDNADAVPDPEVEAPQEYNFSPLEVITKESLDSVSVWGMSAQDICSS